MIQNLLTSGEGVVAGKEAIHSLLHRQIRRHLGTDASIAEPWAGLIRAVDEAYRQGDEDRAMLERALEISSQELLQANSQTRAMLQATPSLSLRVAFDGTVLEYKPSPLTELFCMNARLGDSSGRGLVLRPDFLDRFKSSLNALLQGEPMAIFEIAPDAAPDRLFEVRIVTLSSNQTVVVIRDITEQRAAEAAVRESETRFRLLADELAHQAALIDEARDAIFVRDLDHRITFWSKGAERIYGWPAAETLGRYCYELTDADRAAFETAAQAVLKEGEWSGEMERKAASGASLTVNSRWTLMRDGQGRPKSIFIIETDITERKRLEQQFLRAQRLESVGTLSGGIAHDLNNLLMPIMMGGALLKHYEPDEKSQKVIKNIERSAKRGADLVQQMLSFARGAGGSREAVDLDDVVAEVQSIAETTFPKNVHFETDIAEDLWSILGDATQIHQVLLNLCVNARDAMLCGGRIVLSARNADLDAHYAAMHGSAIAGRHVVLRVADNGAGMTREVIDKIFEPFFTTKDLGKGTGLGLSTTLRIVQGHGGFVDVFSEPGNGTAIEIFLPANADQTEAANLEWKDEMLPRGDGETILIVDDETAILDITRQTLESFGYKVITAEDGAEAIALYAMHRSEIAVVLTDMMMPVMDGAALIAALRRINPGVQIIITSGNNANVNAAKAANANVHHFLAKPYTAEVMLSTLSNILGKDRVRFPTLDGVRFGDLVGQAN
jgi:PAS domain S-box-containing protein